MARNDRYSLWDPITFATDILNGRPGHNKECSYVYFIVSLDRGVQNEKELKLVICIIRFCITPSMIYPVFNMK